MNKFDELYESIMTEEKDIDGVHPSHQKAYKSALADLIKRALVKVKKVSGDVPPPLQRSIEATIESYLWDEYSRVGLDKPVFANMTHIQVVNDLKDIKKKVMSEFEW